MPSRLRVELVLKTRDKVPNHSFMLEQLKKNFESVQRRIADAAASASRAADEITLVGVTKYVDVATTRGLFEAGCVDLGENRPQVVWEKSSALAELPINWHMIGHLQRNKVKRMVERCGLIHSVDSERLLTAIDKAAADQEKTCRVLLEINVSGESAKHGFSKQEIPAALEFVSGLKHIQVEGLMCMAGLVGDADDARREFAMLRGVKEEFESDSPSNVDLKELSMGMSGDFEIAIEEGATLVRVGSLLFDGV